MKATIQTFLKTMTVLFPIFLLGFGGAEQDHLLIGTWYAIDQGEIHSVTFSQDQTFELHVKGFNIQPKQWKDKNMVMTTNYKIVESDINRINMTIKVIRPDTTLTMDLKGIYDFKNDSTLQLDFRPSNQPLLQTFTNQSVVYASNMKDLKPELPKKDREGNYIFIYPIGDQIVKDTIRPSDPRFIEIDSLYQKVMRQ